MATILRPTAALVLILGFCAGATAGTSDPVQLRGAGAVHTLAFAPDGRTVAGGGNFARLQLWDAVDGKDLHDFAETTAGPNAVAFAPDGKALASAGHRYGLSLFDPDTGKELRRFDTQASPQGFWALAFSPDGKALAAGGVFGEVLIFEVETGRRLLDVQSGPSPVLALAFSADGKTLVAGKQLAGGIHQWDVASGKEVRKVNARQNCHSINFSPDGTVAAWVGDDLGVRFTETATGKELRRADLPQPRDIQRLVFSADGRTVALGGIDRTVRLIEVASGKECGSFTGHSGRVAGLAFTTDGRALATGSDDTTVLVWDVTGRGRGGPVAKPSAKDLDAFWSDLASDDAARAYRAAWALAAAPAEAVPHLRSRLAPAAEADDKRIARLIADLDADDFDVRDKAAAELEGLGKAAAAALRKVLQDPPSVEVRVRAMKLMDRLGEGKAAEGAGPSGVQLRGQRAVAALEYAGTAEARKLLAELAKGSSESALTREAKAAVERLERRPVKVP